MTRLLDQVLEDARLGAAWRAAEEALPEGWRLSGVTSAGFWPNWYVSAMAQSKSPDERCDHGEVHRGKRDSAGVVGPTPAAALLALAEKLRERP